MYKDKNSSYNNSFFGNFVYKQLIPEDHPLKKLKQIANFEELEEDLKHLYSKNGQKAYSPTIMMRICILQYLYNLSDTKVMNMVKYDIPAKYYAGLAIDEEVPDASLLTYFRQRLSDEYFNQIFQKTIKIAAKNGLRLGDILLIDSTHSNAKINIQTQKNKTTKNDHNDQDACFGRKNKDKSFFGYKHHMAIENNHSLITATNVTPGNIHDSEELIGLVENSEEVVPKSEIISADKAYDARRIHSYLEQEKQIFSAICLKKNRLQTRNNTLKIEDSFTGSDNPYLTKYLDPRYEKGLKERYKVERSFAESKGYHGLKRSKYLGLSKNLLQSYLTATVINLKHILRAMDPNLHFYKVH